MMQKLKSFSFVFVFVIAALGLTIPSARAAILTVDGGQLTGATNVDLGSLLGFFNVSFVDGTCIDLFTGCDSVSDFDFGSSADALTAAQALMNQVFVDDHSSAPGILFDSNPALTFGCIATICRTLIPFDLAFTSVQVGVALNRTTEADDATFTTGFNTDFNTLTNVATNYASFTPVAAVPLPPAMLLFGSGLVALFGFARAGGRRRRQV